MAEHECFIDDFSNGVIGAKVVSATHPDFPFLGFMDSNNISHFGNAITSRPPLRFICRAPGNHFHRQQFVESVDGKIYLLCITEPSPTSINNEKILVVEIDNGIRVKTETAKITISSIVGEGSDIVITTPSADPDLKLISCLFFNDQQLDLYYTEKLTTTAGQPKKYKISPLLGDKENIPIVNGVIYHTFRNIVFREYNLSDFRILPAPAPAPEARYKRSLFVNATPLDKGTFYRPGDSISSTTPESTIEDEFIYEDIFSTLLPIFPDGDHGIYLTGDKLITLHSNGVLNSLPNDNITKTNSAADLVFGRNREETIGTPPNDFKKMSIQITVGTNILNIPESSGTELYWIRGGFNSDTIIMSTNRGIYSIKLDASNTARILSIITIDRKISSKAKPAFYNNYIIYADNSTESLSYIYADIYSDRATSGTIGEQSDILVNRTEIIKLDLIYINNNPCIIILTKEGSVFCGSILDNHKDRSLRISLGEWFKGMQIADFIVFNRGSDKNVVLFSISYKGNNFISSITTESVPKFRDYRLNRFPSLDFYIEILADKMYPIKPNFVLTSLPNQINNSDIIYKIVADQAFFNPTLIGAQIATRIYTITIESIESDIVAYGSLRTYESGELKHNINGIININTYDGYDLKINKITGTNHIKVLDNPEGYSVDINSREPITKDNAVSVEVNKFSGTCTFNHGRNILVGIPYKTYFYSSNITIPSKVTNKTIVRFKSIFAYIRTIGINDQIIKCCITEWINIKNKKINVMQEEKKSSNNPKFTHILTHYLRKDISYIPLLYLESDSLIPLFITRIDFRFTYD